MRSPISSAMFPALWATLAACGAMTTSTTIGGPCEASGKCDSGQIRDRTAPGGPVCLDASGDLDGDGIPNGKDFCEHMAGGANDEDGDGIGDECDACPIAPPGQAESDGDAVTSPCDPDTRTPGDRILLFNGFNTAVAGAGPAWKFQNGEAVVTLAADADADLKFPLATASNHLAIFAAYRIDEVAAGTTQADAAVRSKTILPLGTSLVQCGGSRVAGADAVVLAYTDTSDVTTPNTKTVTTAFSPTAPYRIVEQLDGATANCALATDTDANSGATQLTADGSVPTHAFLYARGATVRFSYILVVGQ